MKLHVLLALLLLPGCDFYIDAPIDVGGVNTSDGENQEGEAELEGEEQYDETDWEDGWENDYEEADTETYDTAWDEEWQVEHLGEDNDGDGIYTEDFTPDCDDNNSEIHPFVEEVVDGIDNDCDGVVDETLSEPNAFDVFGDSFDYCDASDGTEGDYSDLDFSKIHVNDAVLAQCIEEQADVECGSDEIPEVCSDVFRFLQE